MLCFVTDHLGASSSPSPQTPGWRPGNPGHALILSESIEPGADVCQGAAGIFPTISASSTSIETSNFPRQLRRPYPSNCGFPPSCTSHSETKQFQ